MNTNEKAAATEEPRPDDQAWAGRGHDGAGGADATGRSEPEADQHPKDDAQPVARASVSVPTEADMRALGRQLAPLLRPGDLLVLAGPLGAGKTTFVQGLGAGLGVATPITSPSFVLARVHEVPPGSVPLVHGDAYRLGSVAELDDLDLETPAEGAVTVVEWGEGMAEDLADERLEIFIEREDGDERVVRLTGVGRRWQGALG